jgi:hypothetical protein
MGLLALLSPLLPPLGPLLGGGAAAWLGGIADF